MSTALRSARFRTWLCARVRFLTCALLLLSLAGYAGRWHRLLELTSHFRVQYLFCAVLGGGVLLALRDFRWALVAAAALAINAAEVAPWYFKPASPVPGAAPALKLLLANVYTDNQESQPLLDLIAREAPDVAVLQEVDDRWLSQLTSLSQIYPAWHALPRADNFGIGLWSRLPAQIKDIDLGQNLIPSLVAEIQWQGKTIRLLATHPLPPVRAEGFQLRNAQLHAIAAWATPAKAPPIGRRDEPARHIVLGDLNVSLWSPFYSDLIRNSGLRNARQGFGILPSWPQNLPLMRIPLDHCLHSNKLATRALRGIL